MIKEVIAIIRPGKWAETLSKLEQIGILGFTRQRVYGRGKQRGLRYNSNDIEGRGISFLPKWMITMVVEDSRVDAVVVILKQTNRTGEIGDGKIFIHSLTDTIRIRTNEDQKQALQ